MKPNVALIDYGMGNLRSVSKALELAGAKVRWVCTPSELKGDAVVLPGVGAFKVAMENLKETGLVPAIKRWIEAEKPFLGICLGYQMLFEKSEEGGSSRGLGIFKGNVRKFSVPKRLKIPHMGWNQIEKKSPTPFLKGVKDGAYFYFVHSYFPVPSDRKIIATETQYGGRFASSVAAKNLFASQFHPEKSGTEGIKILKNFVGLVN